MTVTELWKNLKLTDQIALAIGVEIKSCQSKMEVHRRIIELALTGQKLMEELNGKAMMQMHKMGVMKLIILKIATEEDLKKLED